MIRRVYISERTAPHRDKANNQWPARDPGRSSSGNTELSVTKYCPEWASLGGNRDYLDHSATKCTVMERAYMSALVLKLVF